MDSIWWVIRPVRGGAGTTVWLHHAEVLDKKGNFYTANLRNAQQTDAYTLKGGSEEVRAASSPSTGSAT
jgi:alpha-L-rhamnosidase